MVISNKSKQDMLSRINLWFEEKGYLHDTVREYNLHVTIVKVSKYTLNIRKYKNEPNSVVIISTVKLSPKEKKKLDSIDETMHQQFLRSVKKVGLIDASKLDMIYHMEYCTYDGIEFYRLLEKKEFNKEKFFEIITNMVKVLDLCSDIHAKYLR